MMRRAIQDQEYRIQNTDWSLTGRSQPAAFSPVSAPEHSKETFDVVLDVIWAGIEGFEGWRGH